MIQEMPISSDVPGIPDRHVPIAQYVFNDNQQFGVIGADFNKTHVDFGSAVLPDGRVCTTSSLGKLLDQNIIFQAQIENSLMQDGWDYDLYPNPEIVLMSVTYG